MKRESTIDSGTYDRITLSRNEAMMVEFYRSSDRVASRESASGFANVVGARLANDAVSESRSALASTAVNACIVYLENEIAHRDRHIAELERDLADLRAVQSLAIPAGAHPYRSAAQTATLGRTAEEAPSRPVAASEAAPTRSSASGGWRRVYGALRAGARKSTILCPPLGAAGTFVALGWGTLAWPALTFGAAISACIAGAVAASERGT